VLSLLDHGYSVTIVDNLDNAFEEAYRRMQELAGGKAGKMKFVKVLVPAPPLPSSRSDPAGWAAADCWRSGVLRTWGKGGGGACSGVHASVQPGSARPLVRRPPPAQGDMRSFDDLDRIFAEEKCARARALARRPAGPRRAAPAVPRAAQAAPTGLTAPPAPAGSTP